MDSYSFYKSLYDRELNRRKDLDSSVSVPLTLISIIVAANSYILKQAASFLPEHPFKGALIILSLAALAVSIFFLTRSYNNFFKGFEYRDIGFASEIRSYEIVQLPDYNSKVSAGDAIRFEDELIEKLNEITNNHMRLNDKRGHDLYLAKTFIIVSLALTAFSFVMISLIYL